MSSPDVPADTAGGSMRSRSKPARATDAVSSVPRGAARGGGRVGAATREGVGGGARRDTGDGVWITRDMAAAYQRFHRLGYAHSVEVWHDDELVGGLYGVAIGGLFAGESMFSRVRD